MLGRIADQPAPPTHNDSRTGPGGAHRTGLRYFPWCFGEPVAWRIHLGYPRVSGGEAMRMHGSLSNCPWSSRSRSADPSLLVHSLDVHGLVRLHGQAAYDWVVAARSCLERGRMAAPERVKWGRR